MGPKMENEETFEQKALHALKGRVVQNGKTLRQVAGTSLPDAAGHAVEYLCNELDYEFEFAGEHETVSQRGHDWLNFSAGVLEHIETYTVPQYGDKGSDQATDYESRDHVKQAKKYLDRYGKNSRPGQEILDLMKTAHYCQMAAMKLTKELEAASKRIPLEDWAFPVKEATDASR